MKKNFSFIFIILASVCWGVMSLFVNTLTAGGLDSLQIVGIRTSVSAVVFSVATAVISPKKFKINLKDVWVFICMGVICVALTNFLYIYTIVKSQASIAVVLMYTSPIFVLIFSAVFFKEKITVKKIIVIVLTFSGCVFVAGIIGGDYKIAPIALVTGIGSGLTYGLYSIFGKIALKKYDTFTVSLYSFIFAALSFIPFANFGGTVSVMISNPSLIPFGLGVALVCTVFAYLFYTIGLRGMDAGKAAILCIIEPVVASLIGIFVYHETHDFFKIFGIVLMVGSIVLLNVNIKHKKETPIISELAVSEHAKP